MKKYIANSDISVSVTLPNNRSTRISFSALSNGTSVLYTSDKDIQWALEHHYKFGKLFRLVEDSTSENPHPDKKPVTNKLKTPAPKPAKKNKKPESPVDSPTLPEDETTDESPEMTGDTNEEIADIDNETHDEDEASGYREVTVSDMDSAKDYLAENFDVVRTKLKSEESIRETAFTFGIVFKYL